MRRIGGWDPYNVTEDADLGMRLARFGYRTAIIPSTTYEEAPARIGPWLRQRTRWFKGWMQTWLVHMRSPVPARARARHRQDSLVFQLLVGGTVIAALVHSLFAFQLVSSLVLARWSETAASASLGSCSTTRVIHLSTSTSARAR